MKNSPYRKKKIDAEILDFPCVECSTGVYRVDELRNVIGTVPAQWPHKCIECGHEVYFPHPLPLIKYKDEEFVLAKHVKFIKEEKANKPN